MYQEQDFSVSDRYGGEYESEMRSTLSERVGCAVMHFEDYTGLPLETP
jgi:hypothetical protein